MPTLRNKIGLVIAALLAVGDLSSPFQPTPDGQEGPPFGILLVAAVLGVITLVAIVPAWRKGDRTASRIVVGTRIVSALTALPAFFVDIPAWLMVVAAVSVVLTVVCAVLILAPADRRVPVTD
jgi:hypothetical protein